MLNKLPKLFNRPVILQDMVTYRLGKVPTVKLQNWVRMNRMMIDTRSFSVPAYPYSLQVEPTNRCNLKCPLCPCGRDELGRPPRDMLLSEFQVLVDDMQQYLLLLQLWEWGEPFMNPHLPAMVRYATDHEIQTVTSTNCHFLKDEDYVAEILRAGLTTLIVAVDSTMVKQYEQYRQQGNINQVVAGVELLVALKKKIGAATRIHLRMVVMRQNETEVARIREFARKLGVDLFTVKTVNPSCNDTYQDETLVPENPALRRYEYVPGTWQRVRKDAPCRRVWTMSNILSNGDVVPCCRDYDAELRIGNIFDRPFSEIWMSEEYRELRARIYRGRKSIIKCWHCDESFKLSRVGWYPEIAEFDLEKRNPLLGRILNRYYRPNARVLINQIYKRI